MGAAASVPVQKAAGYEEESGPVTAPLKGVPQAIENAIYIQERWPLIVDPTEQAGRFLRYQRGSFLMAESERDMDKEHLRRLLLGALQYGSMMTICFTTLENVDFDKFFVDGYFPAAVLNKAELFKQEVWQTLLRPEQGDPEPHAFLPRDEFALCLLTRGTFVPEALLERFALITCAETPSGGGGGGEGGGGGGGGGENDLEAVMGAKEVKRHCADLVEAAFEGELDECKRLVDKGMYVDSEDGRKHTPLSDAASQGQRAVVEYLLELGADPNSQSDVGRTPLWRAAYNGQLEMVELLLAAGADPEVKTTEHERPYDVAKDDATRELLANFPREETERMLRARADAMAAALEKRLKTAAEREAHARETMRAELCALAIKGDAGAVKEKLLEVAFEAEKFNERPRVTANTARDERGATLVALAAQYGHVELLTLLLTHHKECDKELGPFADPNDGSVESKVFWTNVNRRDAKGWNPAAIAAFSDQKRALEVLLEHGADPTMKNQYGKSALDLAKDEMASDERTVLKSHAEVRQVLDAWEASRTSKLFGTSGGVKIASDGAAAGEQLPDAGTATAMNIEMNKEAEAAGAGEDDADKKPKQGAKGAGAKKAALAAGAIAAGAKGGAKKGGAKKPKGK